MDEEVFVWITRWHDFQHYRPRRDRGPAWIKDYTAQLDDDRYLKLTDRQRALLGDLRRMFAASRGHLSGNTRMISRRRNAHTMGADLIVLNDAGFIDLCSREVLEHRLELFYNGPRADKELEKELEEIEKEQRP